MGYLIPVSDTLQVHWQGLQGICSKEGIGDEIGITAQAQSIPNKSLFLPDSNYSKSFSSFPNALKSKSIFPWKLRNKYDQFALILLSIYHQYASLPFSYLMTLLH